ncbi:putative MFS sugar transporter [Mycena metata]|uniref:MFS sugar transporter n=1 Tax=Mycena metata TaxID=1033252 RepID=A0AAD7P2Y2_9AGAR|nr:putative MFS sugar transporter [Mycena metata]
MQTYFGLRGTALNAALIWAVIMPAFLLFGYNNAVAGGLLDLPAWTALFPEMDTVHSSGSQKAHNSHIQGTVVGVYTLGGLFGALSCLLTGDKLGRRHTMMLGALVTTIGSIIQSSAFSLAQLTVGRVISGLGFGLISVAAPNWQAECSRASHRGFVIMLEGLFNSAGLATAAWINYGLSHTTGGVSWRFSLAFPCVYSMMIFFSVSFWPESPRWLVKKGRIDEARHVLAALDDVPFDSPDIVQEVREIQISLEETGKGSFRDIFRNGSGRFGNRAFIAAAAQCFQQMCGINVLGYYQTTIFINFLKLNSNTSRILSATVYTWQTLCAPIGLFTIERAGRRKLMILGALGMGMCMAVAAGGTSHPSNQAAVNAAIAFIYLFSTFFVTGYLGLTFLYASEIAPLSVRTPITALSAASRWLFNYVVVEVTPTGFNSLGYQYFIIYAVINWFLILPTVYFLFPETQGLHLESVDRIFLESTSVLDPVRVAKGLRADVVIEKDGGIYLNRENTKSIDEQKEKAV